nr:hypothetical protein [Sphaerochaetaceae bacterium]
MTLNELSILVTGKETTKNDGMITFLSYDSRECIEGSAFFCFKGTKTDGKLFIKQAIANGAIAVITDLPVELPDNVECLVTKENIRSIYAKASGLFFNYPAKNLAIIGVSGTDGKSSTSYFIYQLIKLLGHNCGLSSTVYVDDGTGLRNTPWRNSTPEAFPLHGFLKKACDNSCEYMVIEATSHALSKEYDRL